MTKTINISHFISKDTLSNLKRIQESYNQMIQSNSFKALIDQASTIDKILKINIASFCSSSGIKNLQNTIEIIGRNKNNILSAFYNTPYQSLNFSNQLIQIEDQNSNSLATQGRKFKEDDFIRMDYHCCPVKNLVNSTVQSYPVSNSYNPV